jgi:hypothetical protein
MKMKQQFFTFAACLLAGFILCSCANDSTSPQSTDLRDQRVVFVGASITEAWDFTAYFPGYDFRKVIYFDWDKTQVWAQVAAQSPDIVLVKECGAYFYTDGGTPLNEYENCMIQMVANSRSLGAVPVLATTLPIDVGYGGCTQAQLNDIITFNDWVRSYCQTNGITCMDYYTQIADSEGQLPTNYHDGDGLHPNNAGYEALSPIVIPTLEGAI